MEILSAIAYLVLAGLLFILFAIGASLMVTAVSFVLYKDDNNNEVDILDASWWFFGGLTASVLAVALFIKLNNLFN